MIYVENDQMKRNEEEVEEGTLGFTQSVLE